MHRRNFLNGSQTFFDSQYIRNISEYTEMYQNTSKCTKIHRNVHRNTYIVRYYTLVYTQYVWKCIWIHRNVSTIEIYRLLKYIKTYRNVSKCIDMYRNVSNFHRYKCLVTTHYESYVTFLSTCSSSVWPFLPCYIFNA